MPKYEVLLVNIITLVALSLASPALAGCAQPIGVFVGGGAGPVYAKGGAPLGSQAETWRIRLYNEPQRGPKSAVGSGIILVQTPPQPGVQTSAFGYYERNNATRKFRLTWNEDECTGTLSFDVEPFQATWIDQKGNATTQTYVRADRKYNYMAAAGGSVLIATLDPTILAEGFRPDPYAFSAYVPAYSIRLEKQ
ncbi:hypothetical protein [Methylocystis echinoides]|uniref:hypothetical protein n=1 Tax=Methylocystis echinoides TaxID=29468 RepID=UPI00342A337B